MFVVGGIGGYVYLVFVIVDEVKMLNLVVEIEFVGIIECMEWVVVFKVGFLIFLIFVVVIWWLFWSLVNVFLLFCLFFCLWMLWRIVCKFRLDVVVGIGGYVVGLLCFMVVLVGIVVVI